jgi:hypothetical protein
LVEEGCTFESSSFDGRRDARDTVGHPLLTDTEDGDGGVTVVGDEVMGDDRTT